jgi:hypothetical protein
MKALNLAEGFVAQTFLSYRGHRRRQIELFGAGSQLS